MRELWVNDPVISNNSASASSTQQEDASFLCPTDNEIGDRYDLFATAKNRARP